MKYTKEELAKIKESGKCTTEDINIIFDDINTMLNEGKDLTYACKYYSIFCQILPFLNQDNRINDLITIGNKFLEKNLLEVQKSGIYYGLVQLYHKYTFAPKVVEYGLAFLNTMCDKENIAVLSVNNNLAIILKESGFYEEAYECIERCKEVCKGITQLEQDYLEIINNNNSCYILIKMGKYEKALECKNYIEMILNRNIEKPLYKALVPSISFTSLYVRLYGQNTEDSIIEYIKIMENMINNSVFDHQLKQSIEPHIDFIKKMFELGYNEDALRISNFLLKNDLFIGSFSEIYRLLINYYKKNPGSISEDKYNIIVARYISELELSKESYNNVLALLIKEQFRINDIDKEYDQINIKYQTDLLTSCLNRPSLEMNGQDIINNYQNGVVIFMDMDNLKRTNDTYGHIYGDLLLKEFAGRIKQINRSYLGTIYFYRYSGDEFLVIAPFNKEEAENYINKILEAFEENYKLDRASIHIEFSHGFAFFNKDKLKINTLISEADEKMYECKKTHKNARRQ